MDSEVLCVLLLFLAATSAFKSYDGYQVLETDPLNERSVEALAGIRGEYDFWNEPGAGRKVRIMSSPHELSYLQRYLESSNIGYTVLIPNVQKIIEEEQSRQRKTVAKTHRAISFEKFNRLSEINAYLDEVAAAFPDLAETQVIGSSLEGRDLKILKISGAGTGSKPGIFIDAAIHAREWIAPPVALYTIVQLLENYTTFQPLVDEIDWYILPVLNVDGYEYTFTDDRLWRKTRSFNGDPNCLGVDANRNFDLHWGETPGASSDPCSETYSGPNPFSEPETFALSQYLLNQENIRLYLALHSYGRYFLHPWGWTQDLPPDSDQMMNLATAGANALGAIRGTEYTIGSAANVLYYSTGAARDWAKGVAGIPYSYTWELPEGGFSGFDPPASEIWPVVLESWEAIRTMAEIIRQEGLGK